MTGICRSIVILEFSDGREISWIDPAPIHHRITLNYPGQEFPAIRWFITGYRYIKPSGGLRARWQNRRDIARWQRKRRRE